MEKRKTGRNGWYKIIATADGPKALYKSNDAEEFMFNRTNPTLREYINYSNLYDASGIVAFTLGEFRIVPSNSYHLQYLLRKVQLALFGDTSVENILPNQQEWEAYQTRLDDLSGEELAKNTLYKIDQLFEQGMVMEECCNIGGKVEFDDFQTLFWVYEMLLQKAVGRIEIPEKFHIVSVNYEDFVGQYPALKVLNIV